MIPITLQLKNFLSYGPELQTIDFGHHRLICLSGKNGHGKSALLDAITWAVWGQARKTSGVSKADAHLLRLGQTFMSVTFDFMCNGQTYRIKRDYGKTFAKPYAAVEFGVLDESKTFHALTDKTIRGTQKKIEETIGIDFETFSNTAFLRQGQSHEFSQKSPKERKNVLANILSLQKFELLKKAALEKSKIIQQKQTYLEQTKERITNEIAQKTELEQQQKELTTIFDTLIKKEHELTKTINLCDKEIEALQSTLNKVEVLTITRKHTESNKTQTTKELVSVYHEWRDINQKRTLLESKTGIESQIKQLRITITEHQNRLQKQLEIKEKLIKDKEAVQTTRAALEKKYAQEIELHKRTLQELETTHTIAHKNKDALTVQKNTISKETSSITQEITKLETVLLKTKTDVKAQEKLEQQFEKRKRFFHEWTAQANQAAYELQQLHQKETLVTDFENPSCPLCEQNLSASRKKFLKTQFDKQTQRITKKINRFKTILTKLKALLVEQHATLQKHREQDGVYKKHELELKHKQAEHAKLLTKESEIIHEQQKVEKQIKELSENITKKQAEHEKLALSITKKIEQEPEYVRLTTAIIEHEKALQTVPYNAEQHKNDINQLQQLEKQAQEYTNLKKELEDQTKRYEKIQTHITTIKTLNNELKKLTQEIDSFTKETTKQAHIKQQKQDLTKQLEAIRTQREQHIQTKGTIEAQLAKITQQEQELKAISKDIATSADATFDYQILSQALGKDGIQALLIEEALPEIEQEANNLLSQLTDNQAHIIIESLRDLKKGGTKETLDIKISDPMGVRPYEMYSGGEAFRIDFALRIAISKLLAHRAGTSLQTLIIDEGFGSQDEEGLSRIMDCIYRIQDNFHKVIIVSHLPAMKDQFPVHFCVEKGASGSKVIIVEQG